MPAVSEANTTVLGMTGPSSLHTTRVAYDTVAVDYAELLAPHLRPSHWTVR